MMVGFRPSYFFMFCWRFAGPTAMVVIFAASLVEMFSKGTWYEIWNADKVWIIMLLIINMCPYISYEGPSWPWSYGSWIYNYLCNQCLSPLMLWVRISTRVRCTTWCDKVCQWHGTGWWFSPGPPRYNWNSVESGVKHHQTNKHTYLRKCNYDTVYH